MAMKSGFSNEHSAVRAQLAPGPLREACGFYYQEFDNISETTLKNDPFKVQQQKYYNFHESLRYSAHLYSIYRNYITNSVNSIVSHMTYDNIYD